MSQAMNIDIVVKYNIMLNIDIVVKYNIMLMTLSLVVSLVSALWQGRHQQACS